MRRHFVVLAVIVAMAALVAIADLPPPAAEAIQGNSLYGTVTDRLYRPPGTGLTTELTYSCPMLSLPTYQ